MADSFLGQIKTFALNFAPRKWSQCDGQILAIGQNDALFSLLGTMYGGDGRTSFALPDLRGRIPLHMGQGNGLSSYKPGEKKGSETISLVGSQVPAHSHKFGVSNNKADITEPNKSYYANADTRNAYATSPGTAVKFNSLAVQSEGQGTPHNNVMPFLVLNYCICLQGLFPSR